MEIDEFSLERLALYVTRTIKALDVIDVLSNLMLERGVPEFIRNNNGLEFLATILRNWLKSLGTKTAYITPRVALVRTGIARDLTASFGISSLVGSCSKAWAKRGSSLSNAFTSTHCVRINRLKKATNPRHLANQDQNGKGHAFEFDSSDPNTAGGQATIGFAMK
jgi:hypothetical protein